jgi:hypothetical protein
MSGLAAFRDHCAAMSTAEHKPECQGAKPTPSHIEPIIDDEGYWRGNKRVPEQPPTCQGCNPTKDRALFALLAAEVDDYLAPQVDLFGGLTAEPPRRLCEPETAPGAPNSLAATNDAPGTDNETPAGGTESA